MKIVWKNIFLPENCHVNGHDSLLYVRGGTLEIGMFSLEKPCILSAFVYKYEPLCFMGRNCLDAMLGFGIKIKNKIQKYLKNTDFVERHNTVKGVDQTNERGVSGNDLSPW